MAGELFNAIDESKRFSTKILCHRNPTTLLSTMINQFVCKNPILTSVVNHFHRFRQRQRQKYLCELCERRFRRPAEHDIITCACNKWFNWIYSSAGFRTLRKSCDSCNFSVTSHFRVGAGAQTKTWRREEMCRRRRSISVAVSNTSIMCCDFSQLWAEGIPSWKVIQCIPVCGRKVSPFYFPFPRICDVTAWSAPKAFPFTWHTLRGPGKSSAKLVMQFKFHHGRA